jgi:hypothetical protein
VFCRAFEMHSRATAKRMLRDLSAISKVVVCKETHGCAGVGGPSVDHHSDQPLPPCSHTDDAGALVLRREDVTLATPPLAIWLLGPRAIGASLGAMVLTPQARSRCPSEPEPALYGK